MRPPGPSDRISLETSIRLARAIKFASATITSGAYSTSKICLMAADIRLACCSDQKLKSSSRCSLSVSRSVGSGAVSDGALFWKGAWTSLHDNGIKEGSESRHNGTIRMRDLRTETKLNSEGLSTTYKQMCLVNLKKREKKKWTCRKFRMVLPCSWHCTCHRGGIEPENVKSWWHVRCMEIYLIASHDPRQTISLECYRPHIGITMWTWGSS